MKKYIILATAILLTLAALVGCGDSGAKDPPETTDDPVVDPVVGPGNDSGNDPVTDPSTDPVVDPSTDPAKPDKDDKDDGGSGGLSAEYANSPYAAQIERYYTAISEQWSEIDYFDHGMSPLASYYNIDNALDNIGFGFIDLDNDGTKELILGAVLNAEQDPLVFEIWTIKNNEPLMLAQSGSHNRYYLQYAEEDGIWSVAYEAENGAANHAVYYLQLSSGQFNVIQGIVFDAVANEQAPWFMAYDLDWDVSNDMSIKEDTANSVMNAGRNIYTAAEYFPYSLYK